MNYPKSDMDFIKKMRKKTAITENESDEIFRLFKLYIEYRYSYTKGCNCPSGIGSLWTQLNEWSIKNGDKFEL